MSNFIIEVATFMLLSVSSDGLLLDTSEKMQREFLSKQPGFISRKLVRSSEGKWADIVEWKSLDDARKAADIAFQNPACFAYFSLMDTSSVQVTHFETVKFYLKP